MLYWIGLRSVIIHPNGCHRCSLPWNIHDHKWEKHAKGNDSAMMIVCTGAIIFTSVFIAFIVSFSVVFLPFSREVFQAILVYTQDNDALEDAGDKLIFARIMYRRSLAPSPFRWKLQKWKFLRTSLILMGKLLPHYYVDGIAECRRWWSN